MSAPTCEYATVVTQSPLVRLRRHFACAALLSAAVVFSVAATASWLPGTTSGHSRPSVSPTYSASPTGAAVAASSNSSTNRTAQIIPGSLPNLKQFPTVGIASQTVDSESDMPQSPSSKLACPQWNAYDKRDQMRKDFSNNCRTLASNDTNFEVTLCQSQSHCGQGYFLVERIDKAQCADSMRTEVSWNSRVDSFVKNFLGPDAFYLLFDGPERAAPSSWHHLGDCRYKLPFRLTNPGVFSVSLVHTYDEFGALIESNHTAVRAPVHSQLLPQDFSIDVCSTFCKPFTSESVSLMDLPLCSRIMPQQGVYLRIDETNPTKREKYKQENMGFKYIWEPLGCRFDQRFEQFDNTTCLSARPYSVSLQGDSHLRALWYALDARLTGSTASSGSILRLDEHQHSRYLDATRLSNKLDVQDDGTTVAESSGSTNSLRVQYVSRAHLDNLVDSANHVFAYDEEWGGTLAEMEQDGNDAIVLASGHWLARGFWAGGHFTLERFEDMVEYAMGRLMLMDTRRNTARGKDPWHLVWFGVPATFQYTDSDPLYAQLHESLDWRTNYRLKMFSDLSERAVTRLPSMTVLNTFDTTLPFAQESKQDSTHYLTTPALDALVDELLHKLNLCAV